MSAPEAGGSDCGNSTLLANSTVLKANGAGSKVPKTNDGSSAVPETNNGGYTVPGTPGGGSTVPGCDGCSCSVPRDECVCSAVLGNNEQRSTVHRRTYSSTVVLANINVDLAVLEVIPLDSTTREACGLRVPKDIPLEPTGGMPEAANGRKDSSATLEERTRGQEESALRPLEHNFTEEQLQDSLLPFTQGLPHCDIYSNLSDLFTIVTVDAKASDTGTRRASSKQTIKNFGLNRNKQKQDLFRFKKLCFFSVYFGVLNLYQNNQNKQNCCETNQNKPKQL
jgi:hypothetical protein